MKMPKHDVEDNHSNDSNNNHFTVGLRGCKSASADTNHPNDTSRKQEDSPLRIALADKTANSMLANPLLMASLNSPPVNLSANGSVDLSSHANLRQQQQRLQQNNSSNHSNSLEIGNSDRNNASSPDGHSSPSSSTCSKEMYANLLMQLRHQGITAAASNDSEVSVCGGQQNNSSNHSSQQQQQPQNSQNSSNNAKMSAAARKEKLKSQLCFSCPVCKKRFQRHIAMNAHFQAEHLGSTGGAAGSSSGSSPSASGGDHKICKLCSYVGQDMVAIRNHLLAKHNINLETPTACLVEPEYSRSSASPSYGNGNSRSGTSSPLPSSSSDKKLVKSQQQNTVAVSIIRTSSVVPKSTSVSAIHEENMTASSSTSSTSSCELRTSPPATTAAATVVINDATSISRNFQQNSNDNDDIIEEAKDLSIKKPHVAASAASSMTKRSASPGGLDLVQNNSSNHNNNRKRLKTGNGNRIASGSVMSSSSSSNYSENLPKAPNSPLHSNQDHVSSPTLTNLSSQWQCQHCNIIFPDQTLYFLHRGFHSNPNPWKCNGCGQRCTDMYDFNTHLMSDVHH